MARCTLAIVCALLAAAATAQDNILVLNAPPDRSGMGIRPEDK